MNATANRWLESTLGSGVRSSDIFLVGYPKSGMVWMQFLLIHALVEKRRGDRVDCVSKNRLSPNITDVSPRDSLNLWPYCLRHAPRVFFTHTPFDPRLQRGKVLYMLRDPRDVMVSYYHYQFRVTRGFNSTMDDYLRSDDYYPCLWDAHVRGWVQDPHPGARIVVARYEHLRSQPLEELTRVLRELEVQFTAEDVRRSVELSDFDRLRALEKKHPTFRGADEKHLHARKGKVGGWREELTAAQAAMIEQRYAQTMRWAGYRPGEAARGEAA